jgi:F-type H+-transporting ATPase subunit b
MIAKSLTTWICHFVAVGLMVLGSAGLPNSCQGQQAAELESEVEGGDAHGEASHGDADSHGTADGEEHGGGHGNTNPLSVDPDLAIVTLIIFVLLFAILRKFAWGPIREGLDKREKGIAALLEESKRNNDESRRMLEEHQLKLSKTGEEVREMLDQARRDAEAHRQRVMAEADQAATAQKQRAVKEIVAAKDAALEELARTSVDQAVGLASRIVGRQLNKEDHQQLIQDSIKQFPSRN